ncbi:hypothetical protein F5887DRAFT_923021 [Amanita rubescens]|nr:hypothetical protein F5887DRAFT_923021 [Amanita rubescens]
MTRLPKAIWRRESKLGHAFRVNCLRPGLRIILIATDNAVVRLTAHHCEMMRDCRGLGHDDFWGQELSFVPGRSDYLEGGADRGSQKSQSALTGYGSRDPAMFKLLAAHNTQIRELKFAASMAFIAGGVIYDLFPNVKAFSALEDGDCLPCAHCGISRSHATVENTTIEKTLDSADSFGYCQGTTRVGEFAGHSTAEAEASGHIGPCDDLIGCITVPMLEDLPLVDGGYGEYNRPDYEWGDRERTSVRNGGNALKLYVVRSRGRV